MARPRKHEPPPHRDPPVQFRLESDLGRLVGAFAERNGLNMNEAGKALIALAVVTLDARYYGLVRQLADALGGRQAFVLACLRVHASLEGAAMATQRRTLPEAERPGFVLRVVEGALADRGLAVRTDGVWFLEGQTQGETKPAPAPAEAEHRPGPEVGEPTGRSAVPAGRRKRNIRYLPDELSGPSEGPS